MKGWLAALLLLVTLPAGAESYDDMLQGVKNDFAGDVSELLARGFDVDTTDNQGNTLLILAASNSSTRVFPLLLAARPKLNRKNQFGETALMMATYRKQTGMVKALLEAGAAVNQEGWGPLHYAASAGHLEGLQLMLEAGADVNAKAAEGSTPLIMAARDGHTEVIALLLKYKADPNVVNESGMTALRWAIRREDTDNMELLVEADAQQ
ncbi:ankyrin repeat domain-containing protein [Leeia aquatica]|uniref:Ankyrin repeat domain-containing protein n=1 Tax=Leeia aquatica TaxID=2725557 RepID=A0A847S957_9NEIS|nr:ankyrin repeat domain-containing protein [Leeia aquatica]NLR74126.1 ankyrin repeat domain-containing protein [Leeia aquatica]